MDVANDEEIDFSYHIRGGSRKGSRLDVKCVNKEVCSNIEKVDKHHQKIFYYLFVFLLVNVIAIIIAFIVHIYTYVKHKNKSTKFLQICGYIGGFNILVVIVLFNVLGIISSRKHRLAIKKAILTNCGKDFSKFSDSPIRRRGFPEECINKNPVEI